MARAMKDSGIEWIGVIPEEWKVVRGKTVFRQRNEKGNSICLQLLSPTQKYGVVPQTEYEQLSGMKAVKLDVAADYAQLKTIHEGDYCISLRSFQGGFEYSKYEGVVSPAYQVFYPYIGCNEGYYRYLFKDKTFIDKMNSFTLSLRDGKNIAFSDFANTYIPFPPVGEQASIAAYLDTECARIDAVIEKTRASIEEYKKLKQSVITQAVTKGIRPGRKLKDSGIEWIGEIPEEWEKKKLGQLCSFHNGDRSSNYPSPEDFTDTGIPFIGADALNGRYVDTTASKHISQEKYDNMGGLKIKHGDILYTLRGSTIGKNAYSDFDGGAVASSLMGIRVASNHVTPVFIYYWMNSGQEFIQRDLCINGSTAPNLSAEDVKQYILFIPPITEQFGIINYLDNMIPEIDALIEKKNLIISEIESYKKSLIFEYVTGKKEVAEVV